MTIYTVNRDIEFGVDKPTCRTGTEVRLGHRSPGLAPVEHFSLLRPECVGVFQRLLVEGLVTLRGDVSIVEARGHGISVGLSHGMIPIAQVRDVK